MSHFASGVLATVAAFIVYLLLSAGSATETSTILCWSLPELIIGFLLALLVGFLCRKFIPASAARMLNPVRLVQLIVFLIPFLFELIIANLKVSWSIISGRNIRPAIQKVESPMKTGVGLTLLSTSITYQPGTTVVDVDEMDNSVYVYFLDGGANPKKTVSEKRLFSVINLVKWIRRICE